jgi:nucleolin
MTTAAAAATFRSLLQTTANGVPVPLPSVRFQSLQRQCVGLHLFAPLPDRPVLLPPSAAAGEAFSSDGEDYSEEDEEYLEEEEADEAEEVEAPPAYSSPQSRPPRGQEPGRLFLGNLLYTMTSAELSEAFSEAGRVEDAQVPTLKPN